MPWKNASKTLGVFRPMAVRRHIPQTDKTPKSKHLISFKLQIHTPHVINYMLGSQSRETGRRPASKKKATVDLFPPEGLSAAHPLAENSLGRAYQASKSKQAGKKPASISAWPESSSSPSFPPRPHLPLIPSCRTFAARTNTLN